MERGWNGLPFRPISQAYQAKFSGKVYKIPVTVVDDCPNRRGLKGMETCIFCDVWGSAATTESFTMGLRQQIEVFQKKIQQKYNANQFLVYFQAYTNTFTKLETLRINFETALSFPFVKGFVVGTRPDCLSKGVLELWQEFHQKSYVSVELGVQSFDDEQLIFMKRGHSREQSLKAIEKIHQTTTVDLGIHLIFGWPTETDQQIIETAKICNDLPVTNIKLHNLHVLKGTGLETLYHQGQFQPVDFETYARRVQLFLEHLSPRIFIHRLAAHSSRPDELIAPAWTADKMKTHQGLIDFLRAQQSFQSKHFLPQQEQDKDLILQIKKQALATL
jgi:radical SAM protein (TIGR01212 family)